MTKARRELQDFLAALARNPPRNESSAQEPVLVRTRRMLDRLRSLGVQVDGPGYRLSRPFDRASWRSLL